MESIIAVTFLAALLCTTWKSYRAAFIYVYVPVLVCLPAWPRWVLPALPDATFQQAAILPIAAVSCYQNRLVFLRKLGPLGYLVVGFLLLCGVSELINAGFAEAQNLMFDMICSGLLPYLVARDVLAKPSDRLKAIQVFVLCMSGVVVAALFEARFGTNPFRILFDPFFPGQGDVWVTTFRYGLARASGPYGHAIMAGMMFLISLGLQCWLESNKLWKAPWARTEIGPVKASSVLTFWNVLGLVVTWVRGPQLGALGAWISFRVSRTRKPLVYFRRTLWASIVILVPASIWFYSYASVGRSAAVTAGQESAAYRMELLGKYADVLVHRLWLGWGRNGWPKSPQMPSIDNYYLLMGLMHGLPAVLLLTAILLFVMVRTFRRGLQLAPIDAVRSSLGFTLFSIYVGLSFSLATAYMGENVFPTFFFLVGLTDAFLREACTAPVRVNAPKQIQWRAAPRFRRVIQW